MEHGIIWPGNKKFAVCLTHDVDRVRKTYQYITQFKKGVYLQIRQLLKFKNPYWCFPIIMRIEDKFDVRSTFFFMQESKKLNLLRPKQWVLSAGKYKFNDKKICKIIQLFHKNGWEIGLHGSYDSYINEDLLREEKKELEDVLGAEVVGIRQHYLNLEIPKTWEIQQKVDFLYDASFGFSDRVGFRDGRYLPFHPFNDSFLVIPLTIMDSALFSNYDSEDSIWRECLGLIETVEEHKGLLTVLWHQRVFNEKEFPGWSMIYQKLIEECRERNASFVTCKDILNLCVKNE